MVLFIGDDVGDEATRYLVDRLPELRARHTVDLVVANAENTAADGLGMGRVQVEQLLSGGVDVITGGNHSWDSPESVGLLNPAASGSARQRGPRVPGR
ncbi:YmdB family metallophosphoesterase, partial [Salinispora arenicola]|uniref:YmdB family metallophosphoesterase n=1 Tax=Salinispora arenicola TaxID=168697 RepID=UPI0027DB17E7